MEHFMFCLRAMRLICACVLPLICFSAHGSGRFGRATNTVQKQWAFDLKVVDVTPATSVEFKPITVKFTVRPYTFGIKGDLPPPPAFKVCPDQQDTGAGTTCSSLIVNYSEGKLITGSVTALAPMADVRPSVRIVLFTEAIPRGGEFPVRNALAEASQPYTTSATYIARLEGFDVRQSRSAVTDTVWATMLGMVKANPPHPSDSKDACSIATEHFCRTAMRIGDYSSGSVSTTGVQVGPFELTPNKEDDLRFTIALSNIGDNTWVQELGESVANGFSMAGMVALSTTSYGGSGEALHKGMESFHKSAFAGCDGPLVETTYIIPNKPLSASSETLYGISMASGIRRFSPDDLFVSNDDDGRCGDDGHYKIRYSVLRTSWRNIPRDF